MAYQGEHIYLALAYPILTNKYVTVGLIEDRNYEVGVLFSQHKRKSILLEFFEWNELMIFHERNLQHILMCEEENDKCENKKSLKRTKHFVQLNDSTGNRLLFSETEWTCFCNLIPLLNKYIIRLFYDQEYFQSYINQVLSTGSYVSPTFYFPTFFIESKPSRLDNQLTFDRLYDELLMRGKVGEKLVIPVVQ